MPPFFLKLLLAAALAAASCRPPPPDPLEGLPAAEGLEPDPERQPSAPAQETAFAAAAHILVSWKGAEGAYRKIKLDRQGARLRAEHLLRLARARGQDFAQLARSFSDDGQTSSKGGDLGLFVRGERHPALEEAVFSLGPGQVAGPVESPRGFHIVMRDPTEWAQAADLVVSYDGAVRYRPRQSRSRHEAGRLAESLHKRLLAGEDFSKLAAEFSDGEGRERGGTVPPFRRGSRHADFEKTVFALRPGDFSQVIETPTGFHIVKRLPIEKVALRMLQLNYGLKILPSDPPPKRSPQEAKELMGQILAQLKAGQDFAVLVSRYSDGAERAPKWYARGELSLALEQVAFSLAPGGVSEPIDTGYSLVLIKRIH